MRQTHRVSNRLKCSFYDVVSFSLCPIARHFVCEQQQKLEVRKIVFAPNDRRKQNDFRYSIVNYAFLLPNENVKLFFFFSTHIVL